MATRRNANNRNIHSWILTSISSGVLYGLMAYFLKLSLTGFSLSLPGLITFVTNPFAWVTFVVFLGGFLLMQKSLYTGNVTLVTPVIGGISIIIPVLFAFAFLAEPISTMKWAGVVLIIIGTVGLGK